MAESLTDVQAEIEKLEARHAEDPQGRFFVPLANAYRRGGDAERAEKLLRDGLRRHPEYLSAHVILGRCLEDRGAVEEAASEFRYVLSVDPQNLIALSRLGELAAVAGRPGEATQWYEQLLAVDPENDEARRALDSLPGQEPTMDAGQHAVADVDGARGAAGEEHLVFESDPDDESAPHAAEDTLGSEVVTETIAELYARQGLTDRAAAVYRELIRRRGSDPALEARLAELEAQQSEAEPWTGADDGAAPADLAVEDEHALPAFSEEAAPEEFDPFDDSFEAGFPRAAGAERPATITAFLRELVSWSPDRPAGAAQLTAPEDELSRWTEQEPDEDALQTGMTPAWEMDGTGGSATEPETSAQDAAVAFPWDLEQEQWNPEPNPAEPEAPTRAEIAEISEPVPAPDVEDPPAEAAPEEDDDLESFQAWLRSLKR